MMQHSGNVFVILLLAIFTTRSHQVDIELSQFQGNNDRQLCLDIAPAACCRFVPNGNPFQKQTYYRAQFSNMQNLDFATVWTYTRHLFAPAPPGAPPPIRNCYGTVLDVHAGEGDWTYEDNQPPAGGGPVEGGGENVLPALLPVVPQPPAAFGSPDGRPGINANPFRPAGGVSRSGPAYAGGFPGVRPFLGPARTRITGASYVRLDPEKARMAAAEGIKAYVWGGSNLISELGKGGFGGLRRRERGKRQEAEAESGELKLYPPGEWVYPTVLTTNGVNYTQQGGARSLKYSSDDGNVIDFSVDECSNRIFCQTDLDCGGSTSGCYCARSNIDKAPLDFGRAGAFMGTCKQGPAAS